MNKIPRIFCVTLKETPLRTKGFIEVATAAGLEVTPFYGILGTKLGLSPKFPNEIEAPGLNIMMNERALGCALSHFVLWNHLKLLPEEEFLVFEDDALVPPDFVDRFQELYARLPKDWQMVYVGWIRYGKDEPPVLIDTGISIRIPTATHAYLVKKSVLDDLCNSVMPFQTPIDLTLVHRVLPKIKYYVFDPPLVTQRSYLNTTDSIWTSLVYDWQNDLYGCKKDIVKDLSLVAGWHNAERDDKNIWRWSKNVFSIKIPSQVDSIVIDCSTPVENSIEIGEGDSKLIVPLKIGENSVTIVTKGMDMLEGKMTFPFLPSRQDSRSTDQRVLGICLKRITLNMGTTSIPIGIKDLSAPVAPAMSFKL